MRKDNRVFNPEYPLNQGTLSATFYLNKYDAQFMSESGQKDVIKEFCSKIGVIRNSQKVTGFTLEGCNVGSARGNADTLIKNVLHRSEISYETFSKQENKLDIIHGIQQNKNQNQNEFPPQYVRLIKYLKEWHYAKMMKYFKEVTDLAEKKINDERLKIQEQKKAEQEKIRAEKKAEEDRKKAEQEKIRAEQKAEEEKIRAQIDAANALLQQQEEDDEESSEEEEEVEDDEDSNGEEEEADTSEEEDETSSDGQEVEHDEDSNGEVEDDKDEKEDVNKIFEESKKCEKEAALLLMDHVEGLSYNKTNGKELLDFVKQYLNKK